MAAHLSVACAIVAVLLLQARGQRLSTRGSLILDESGSPVHLHCANWYGLEEDGFAPGGLQFRSPASIAETIQSLGFNCVRLPVSAELVLNKTTTYGPAVSHYPPLQGATGLQALEATVEALSAAKLRTIVDLHTLTSGWCCSGDDGQGLWYSANVSAAQWEASLVALAQRFKENPWVVGLDLKNEPRDTVINGESLKVTWSSGDPRTDWKPAAQAAAEKVLAVNPQLLIIVEGIDYAGNLAGVRSDPVKLSVEGRLVYEAHDYGYWFNRESVPSYEAFAAQLDSSFGFIVQDDIAPLWIGEFGNCNSPTDTCLRDTAHSWQAQWWQYVRQYIVERGMHWGIWSIDGTESYAPPSRHFNSTEGYGVLNKTWDGPSNPVFLQDLQDLMQNRTE